MSGEATEIPAAVVTNQVPVRKEASAEKKSLVITPEAQGQMRELDRFVADREIVAETFGWGLTVADNGNSERVVEFVAPDPDKVFVMNSLFLSQDQSRLMELLAEPRKNQK